MDMDMYMDMEMDRHMHMYVCMYMFSCLRIHAYIVAFLQMRTWAWTCGHT